jgi:hypothetical protein
MKIHARINATFQVIRAWIFILLSVLEGTQRVPPTCTTHTWRTPVNVVGNPAPTKVILKISKIEKKVSIDHTRTCIQT